MCDITEVLEFIKIKPRTKTEIQKHFNLNATITYRKLKFLQKCGELSVIELTGQTSRVGRVFIYKAIGN